MFKLNTIRSVLSIVSVEDLHLEYLDVKTAFLMVTWKKTSTCISHKDMLSLEKRKWCVNSKRVYTVRSRPHDNSTSNLIGLCATQVTNDVMQTIVFISNVLMTVTLFYFCM